MAEELNNEFDVQARAQKHFEESVKEKVKNHQALNDVEIAHLCPVALKDQMSEGDIKKLGLSKHYSFVPTMKVVNDLRELGYECVDATQVKARKNQLMGIKSICLHLNTLTIKLKVVKNTHKYY